MITNEFSFCLQPSSIEGVGVFAVEDIEIGTKLMLKPDGYKSRLLKKKDVPEKFLKYCVEDENPSLLRCPNEFNHMWLCWFLNHSETPNAQGNEEDNFMYYAIKNIKKGEEITINYNTLT